MFCGGGTMRDDWEDLEKPLQQLLGLVKKRLDASERCEIEGYIAVNEFEAALEALVDILVAKREPVSDRFLEAARKIAIAMDLPGEAARLARELGKKN